MRRFYDYSGSGRSIAMRTGKRQERAGKDKKNSFIKVILRSAGAEMLRLNFISEEYSFKGKQELRK